MKTHLSFSRFGNAVLAFLLGAVAPSHVFADNAAQIFATPGEAVTALGRATAATNQAVLGTIFGDAAKQLVNPDTVQGASELMEFAAAFNVTNRLVRESDTRMVLEIGAQAWPFPIPLVKVANGWQFDTAAGTEELINRRIGRNELDVLRVLRACAQAQREYAGRDRDGDTVLEYAQRLRSTPGQTDGLYWRFDLNGEVSPLGPLVAFAQGEGYGRNATTSTGPRPFHGYYFKLLDRQGGHAPGGKYEYIINGNMIGGFAFVAWPAEYGESGVMTFIVNQQGRVYQRDLGTKTARTVKDLRAYDPDDKWQISAD